MLVGLHEVIDREVVLAVEEPGAAPNNLLELDHLLNRSHQHDVTDVPCVHTGREFPRRGQNRGDGLLVVLERSQVLLADLTIVGGHAGTVIRMLAVLNLVDEVANREGMVLRGAEDQRLLGLVDLFHEDLHALLLTFPNLDDPIEVVFPVALAFLDLTLDHVIVLGVDVVVERGLDLHDLEGGEIAVVDPLLERVGVHRVAEVVVGVSVGIASWGGGHTQLHGRREILQDASPIALILRTAPMAFVDHDEVEEVRRVVTKARLGIACLVMAGHEGLENREEDTAVLGHPSLAADYRRVDTDQGVFGEGTEGVEGLVREDIAVGEEQHSRATRRLLALADPLAPVGQIPAAVKELPGDLEGDRGLSRARGQGEEDTVPAFRDCVQDLHDRIVLEVSRGPLPAVVVKRDR